LKITEVRIFPTESKDGKLKAFATMTFDDWFVVRNVKVIAGTSGLFVAMPSRKAVDPCPKCGFKNARGSRFCNQCGVEITLRVSTPLAEEKKQGSHMDVAHPITQECRVYIQDQILHAFKGEKDKQCAEGSAYRPPSEDDLNMISSRFAGDIKRSFGAQQGAVPGAGMNLEAPNDIEL
jgi:stage V sporulation protein G